MSWWAEGREREREAGREGTHDVENRLLLVRAAAEAQGPQAAQHGPGGDLGAGDAVREAAREVEEGQLAQRRGGRGDGLVDELEHEGRVEAEVQARELRRAEPDRVAGRQQLQLARGLQLQHRQAAARHGDPPERVRVHAELPAVPDHELGHVGAGVGRVFLQLGGAHGFRAAGEVLDAPEGLDCLVFGGEEIFPAFCYS